MLRGMSKPFPLSDNEVIDVGPPKSRRWRIWVIVAIVILFIVLSRSLAVYLSALWFSSVGYSPVYWYIFKLKAGLFFAFFVLTVAILRGAFWLFERVFASHALERRTIVV